MAAQPCEPPAPIVSLHLPEAVAVHPGYVASLPAPGAWGQPVRPTVTKTPSAVPLPRKQTEEPTAVLHTVLQRLHETDRGRHGADEVQPTVTLSGAPVAALVRRVRR